MNSRKLTSIIMFGLTVLFSAVSLFAQGSSFSDPNVEYKFDLPDVKWKITVKASATNANVEYVYGDRLDGHLTVRKQTVAKDALLSDVISDDETKRQFLPGYVAGKTESFSGKSNGTVFNFEYVASGRSMSGRYYFLRTGPTSVYILRFAGQKDSLRSLRGQTDAIARSFAIN